MNILENFVLIVGRFCKKSESHSRKTGKILTYPAAFFLTAAVLLAISTALKIYPFGENSLAVWDANVQYVDFLAYFRRMLLGEAGWKYTFSKTFGGDLAGFRGYYLNSPFNLLVLFFENWEMPKAFQLIYFLKVAFSAASCQFYFNRKSERADWGALIFSVTYGLTGYQFVYGYNIMWLDAVILLPLLAWCIESMAGDGREYGRYSLILAAGLYTCYYTGYMLCGFAVLYYLVLWLVYDCRNVKKLLGFAAASAIGAGLTAVFLLPIYISLSGGPDRSVLESVWMGTNFRWEELLGQITASGFRLEQIPTPGLPPLFSGLLILWLVQAFFFDGHINVREKMVSGMMIAVLLVSMWSRSLNIVWQGFTEPNGCGYRYMFLLSFICIGAAKRAWDVHETGKHRPVLAMAILSVSLFLVWRSHIYTGAEDSAGADVVILLLLTAVLVIKKEKVWLRGLGIAVLLLIQMTDLGRNGQAVWKLLMEDAGFDLAGFEQRTIEMNPAVEKVRQWCESGYRMELNHYTRRSYNDSMQYGYAGLSHYSSAESGMVERFEEAIGLSPWLEAEMPDEFTDSLLAVRYRISASEEWKDYPVIDREGKLMIYENPNALPMMFGVEDKERDIWEKIMERRLWGEKWPACKEPLSFRMEKDEWIRCEAELDQSGQILTTIPWDLGWEVWVDGEKTDISVWLDTFIAFDLSGGSHEIILDYQVRGRKAGAVISLLTAVLAAVVWRRKGKVDCFFRSVAV